MLLASASSAFTARQYKPERVRMSTPHVAGSLRVPYLEPTWTFPGSDCVAFVRPACVLCAACVLPMHPCPRGVNTKRITIVMCFCNAPLPPWGKLGASNRQIDRGQCTPTCARVQHHPYRYNHNDTVYAPPPTWGERSRIRCMSFALPSHPRPRGENPSQRLPRPTAIERCPHSSQHVLRNIHDASERQAALLHRFVKHGTITVAPLTATSPRR